MSDDSNNYYSQTMNQDDTPPEEDQSDDELECPLGDDWGWIFDKMWHDKYGSITRDQLSRQICLEKTIKNDTSLYEENLSWRIIDLKMNYPVYCRGLVNGEYVVYRIHILGGVKPNLSGPHYIQIEDDPPFWVHSLTALRKKFLKFEDFVSFERSSFVTFEFDYLTAIRLKMIRQILRIDLLTPTEMIYISPEKMYSYNSHCMQPSHKSLSPRSEHQIERLVFNIKQIYYRDLHILPSHDEIIKLLTEN
jgi:hypothetical protein